MSNEKLTNVIREEKALIESELSKFVKSIGPGLAPQVEYALLSGGKRLRPLTVLFSSQSVGGERRKAVPLALSFEFAHASSLIHDDIIDTDAFRRGKPAFHRNWSVNSGIVTGDLLIGYSVYLASSYSERILKIIAQSAIKTCQGEQMDMKLTLGSTEEEYFQMIESKSASLFQAAAGCGALVGGASTKEFECLSDFGKYFGITYQLRDDLIDLEPGGGQAWEDIKKGRISLPLIHLYKTSNRAGKAFVDRALRVDKPEDSCEIESVAKSVFEKLKESGSIRYAENKLEEYYKLTASSLADLRDGPYKLVLLRMAKQLKRN